ncbi:MAG: GNAT family N-acetyltransferase [Aquincola sp.]|nr:GNAT family N-acetyltransferase [Aquincola sp.]
MPYVIRPFEPTDYPAAMALWNRTAGVGLSEADERAPVERFLVRNQGLSFVALEAQVIVGTILCGHDGRRGLIHHLVSAEGHRRRGIARALLLRGLAALRTQGIDKTHLLVFRVNEEGLAFWRSVSAVERTELALFSLSTGDA